MDGPTGAHAPPRSRRLAGPLIGLALLAAAGWAIWTQQGREGLGDAWGALRSAPWWMHVLLIASVGGVIVTASAAHWLLMRRYGRVGRVEMLSVICSASLLNYVPLRPGLFGRLAYHKKVNGIALRDAVRAVIWANVLIVGASLGLLVVTPVGALLDGPRGGAMAAIGATLATLGLAGVIRGDARRSLAGALGVRLLEMLIWGVRFWTCFALIGAPIPWAAAVVLAAGHTLALMIPLSGNGLGVSELYVGLAAAMLPASIGGGAIDDPTTGMVAGVLSRAGELVVLLPAGLAGGAGVTRRLRASAPVTPA